MGASLNLYLASDCALSKYELLQYQTITYYVLIVSFSFMNTTVTRSTNKTPYEIVFGQKPNTFHNASISVPSINLQDIEDIVEDNEGEETTPVQFAVSPRERTAANTSLIESD